MRKKDPNRKAYILVTLKLWNCETEQDRRYMVKEIKEDILKLEICGYGCVRPISAKRFKPVEKP